MTEDRVIKRYKNFILGVCNCGCQSEINIRRGDGYILKYKYNHHNRGSNNANWKNGKNSHRGYILIYAPDHPFAGYGGYVMEHRLIMEKHLGRYLMKHEIIHHIDRNPKNNNISNLQLVTRAKHNIIHKKIDTTGRKCSECSETKTYDWHFNHDKTAYLCERCYCRWKYRRNHAQQRMATS